MGSADCFRIGPSGDALLTSAEASGWAVTFAALVRLTIQLDQLSVIDIGPECFLNCIEINVVTVGGQLNSMDLIGPRPRKI